MENNEYKRYVLEYEENYRRYTFGQDRDQEHEERKRKAALYIRLHFKTLMKDEAYRIAYYKLIDEFARAFAYSAKGKSLFYVSEKERESQNGVLDLEISVAGKEKIEEFKEDASYIVEWVKAGKSLIVYI